MTVQASHLKITPKHRLGTLENLQKFAKLEAERLKNDQAEFDRWFFCVTGRIGCFPPEFFSAPTIGTDAYWREQLRKLEYSLYVSCALCSDWFELQEFADAAEYSIKNCPFCAHTRSDSTESDEEVKPHLVPITKPQR
ncbi:MAG: hypothetical protein KF686_10875 [Ramlibacter sp.]|nr:hypothetical protein [Ramlibacter sp.]